MAQDRTALIHRVLRNLGALPQGQSPSAEEYESIDNLIDPMLENLRIRNIAKVGDADYIEDEYFLPLGHILAAIASSEFGQDANAAIWALKERAEIDLKYMYEQLYREQPYNMRTDYYPTCGRPFNWTTGC